MRVSFDYFDTVKQNLNKIETAQIFRMFINTNLNFE